MKELLDKLVGKDGVKIAIAPDPSTTALAAVFIFIALTAALFLYKRVF